MVCWFLVSLGPASVILGTSVGVITQDDMDFAVQIFTDVQAASDNVTGCAILQKLNLNNNRVRCIACDR
jgi:hypothetical protein